MRTHRLSSNRVTKRTKGHAGTLLQSTAVAGVYNIVDNDPVQAAITEPASEDEAVICSTTCSSASLPQRTN